MTRAEALRQVAGHAAANLSASSFDEATGIDPYEPVSDADEARLMWAIEEVERRLYRMGGKG